MRTAAPRRRLTPGTRPAYDSPALRAAQGRPPTARTPPHRRIVSVPISMHGAAAAFNGDWLERVSQVVHLLLAVALLAFFVVIVPALWNLRKSYTKVSGLVDRLSADLTPLTARAGQIANDVQHVASAVRADLARVTALVARTETRIETTMERAEARARDLDALLALAQAQAEESLIAAASTMAGVRQGFASLRDELAGVSHHGGDRDRAFDDADAYDHADHADHADHDERHDDELRGPRIRARDH